MEVWGQRLTCKASKNISFYFKKECCERVSLWSACVFRIVGVITTAGQSSSQSPSLSSISHVRCSNNSESELFDCFWWIEVEELKAAEEAYFATGFLFLSPSHSNARRAAVHRSLSKISSMSSPKSAPVHKHVGAFILSYFWCSHSSYSSSSSSRPTRAKGLILHFLVE